MMKRIVAILLCLLPTAAVAEPHTLALRAVIPCTDGAVPMKDLSQGATYCLDSQVVFSQDDVSSALSPLGARSTKASLRARPEKDDKL